MSRKTVGVCMTPTLIDQFEIADSVVVVIDVLRATSSMCVAFDYGMKAIYPVVSVEECRKFREKGFLIAAERHGVKQEGFDFGNSPYSYMTDKVKGKSLGMTTTNGTVALQEARKRNAKQILVGSFANISILVEYLIAQNENVVLLCAGWQNRPNLEDTIFAGAMVRKLRSHFRLFEDTALIAETLFKAANLRKKYFFKNSSHFLRLTHLEIEKDVKYCMRRDTHKVLPVLVGDRLVNKLNTEQFEAAVREVVDNK